MPLTPEVEKLLRSPTKPQRPGELKSPQSYGRSNAKVPPKPHHMARNLDTGYYEPAKVLSVHEQSTISDIRRCVADILGIAEGIISPKFLNNLRQLIVEDRLIMAPSALEMALGGYYHIPRITRGSVPLAAVARTRQMLMTLSVLDALVRYSAGKMKTNSDIGPPDKVPDNKVHPPYRKSTRPTCPKHKLYLRGDGTCKRCLKEAEDAAGTGQSESV
jgi:hypothetical protein